MKYVRYGSFDDSAREFNIRQTDRVISFFNEAKDTNMIELKTSMAHVSCHKAHIDG